MRLFAIALFAAAVGCGSTKPESQAAADTLDADCQATITRGKGHGVGKWFDTAYGYVVFPEVGKAGFIVGGAHGKGQVYEQGKHVGFATIKQGTVGLQIGAQTFSEIIFLKDKVAFDAFKGGNYELGAEATAVALEKGASAQADYSKGVAVFVFGEGGLMAGAAVGGQKFTYEAK
ncbi:MAG: lipid-binding SYLF domain-containing protein [Planctomycetes bacterium]|nr:lipid-binding SYLF domain-containing protein [Planctomycetota bacterium]